MSDVFAMALEYLEDKDDEVVLDEEGNEIPYPVPVDDAEFNEKLEHLMAIESLLVKEGLVSRGMAEEFKEYLPATIALESFTAVPTRVNHKMAVEVVGTAIKFVAMAGIVVLIGGLGLMVYRVLKRVKKLPNNDLARKATAAYSSIENKLKTALDELKSNYPDIKHPQLNWERGEAAARIAASHGVREIEARVLAGKYPFMDNKLIQAAADQGKRVLDFIKTNVMPQVEQLSTAGTDEDISSLTKSIEAFSIGETASNELVRYVRSLGVDVGEDADPVQEFRSVLLAQVPQDKLKEKVGDASPEFKEIDLKASKALRDVRDDFTSIYTRLEAMGKKLEGKKHNLPAAYATKFKELVELAKGPLKSLDGVMEIYDQETQAFNRVTAIKLETTKDGFLSLKTQYDNMAGSDKEKAGLYSKAVSELGKHFSNFKEAIR